jgi:cytochrome c oxidase assembly factor CtaG
MPSALQAALTSWSIPWVATVALALTALVYLRGWYLLRCAGFAGIPPWRTASFLCGLAWLWIALASPMDVFNGWLLTAHMLQHMVLMMVAPPLILLGDPLIPLVRGLPIFAAREFAGPFLNLRAAQRTGRTLTQPVVALVLMGVFMLGWHVPALYELALRSGAWHQFEHACFLVASLIFWWPVVQPWPSTAQWPRWAMVPYLLVADLQNTILSATLVFADRALYASYLDAPRVFGLSPLQDQAAAGAIMWVVGSAAFLVPAILIAVECLTKRTTAGLVARLRKHRPVLEGAWRGVLSKFGLCGRRAEAASFIVLFVAAGLVFTAALALPGSDEDELILRAKQYTGDLGVSIYMGDLSVGENEVTVLVQDSAGAPLLERSVEVSAVASAANPSPETIIAAPSESENKLLHAALLDLPSAGQWQIRVAVQSGQHDETVVFPAEAETHPAGLHDWWPYTMFPLIGVLLLFVYFRRSRGATEVARKLQTDSMSLSSSRRS